MNRLGSNLITVKELCEELKIPKGTFYQWRHSKRFNVPTMRVGRQLQFRRSDVEKWIEDQFEATSE